MDYIRLTIVFNKTTQQFQILGNNKLKDVTKNKLYKQLREELNVNRIYTRRNSVVCLI